MPTVLSVNSSESPALALSLLLANDIDANGHASGGVNYKQRGRRAVGPPLATTSSNETSSFKLMKPLRSIPILRISDFECYSSQTTPVLNDRCCSR
uniref:Uncharacterized protein n=1 Tax=Rhipicephalus zambeziensis TaxID=60191 RepID=A0A224YCA5_9ACAR